MLSVYRNELKYYLSYRQYLYLSSLVSSLLNKDPYCGESKDYYIRSLYFDTPNNRDFYDKMDGHEKRRKTRIRIYDINSDFAKIEIKNRNGQYMLKESLTIDRSQVLSICSGEFSFLNEICYPTANKLKNDFKMNGVSPKIIIDYEREAYLCQINDIRITFDKNIRACPSSRIYSENLPMIPLFHDNTVILEVKYNGSIPKWITNMLSSADFVRSSVSKYCIARQTVY